MSILGVIFSPLPGGFAQTPIDEYRIERFEGAPSPITEGIKIVIIQSGITVELRLPESEARVFLELLKGIIQ